MEVEDESKLELKSEELEITVLLLYPNDEEKTLDGKTNDDEVMTDSLEKVSVVDDSSDSVLEVANSLDDSSVFEVTNSELDVKYSLENLEVEPRDSAEVTDDSPNVEEKSDDSEPDGTKLDSSED